MNENEKRLARLKYLNRNKHILKEEERRELERENFINREKYIILEDKNLGEFVDVCSVDPPRDMSYLGLGRRVKQRLEKIIPFVDDGTRYESLVDGGVYGHPISSKLYGKFEGNIHDISLSVLLRSFNPSSEKEATLCKKVTEEFSRIRKDWGMS